MNNIPWPAFKGGDDEQREHTLDDVVIVEVVSDPFSILDSRLVDIILDEGDELSLALRLGHLGRVVAGEEFALNKFSLVYLIS